MTTIEFQALLGPDRVIRLPDNVPAEPGPVKVTVTKLTEAELAAATRKFIADLIRFAEEHNAGAGLPSDLAENHDYYLHGLPKGIDRP